MLLTCSDITKKSKSSGRFNLNTLPVSFLLWSFRSQFNAFNRAVSHDPILLLLSCTPGYINQAQGIWDRFILHWTWSKLFLTSQTARDVIIVKWINMSLSSFLVTDFSINVNDIWRRHHMRHKFHDTKIVYAPRLYILYDIIVHYFDWSVGGWYDLQN